MTNNTMPQTFAAVDNPCALLPQLRAALYQLMSGQQRAQVRYGDQWLTWQRGNAAELRDEVRRLEFMCSNRPRAVRVGNY